MLRIPPGLVLAASVLAGGTFLQAGPALLTAGALAAVHALRANRVTGLFLAVALGAAAGALRAPQATVAPDTSRPLQVTARIVGWDVGEWSIQVEMEILRLGEERAPGTPAIAYAPLSWGPQPGSAYLRFRGTFQNPETPGNPGQRTINGMQLRVDSEEPPCWGPGPPPRILGIHRAIRSRLKERLPGFPARLSEAMLLGRSRALTPEERAVFRSTGVSHLTAVSGLHISLAATLAAVLLSPISRTLGLAGASALALAYAALAGWSPSATRASAMALIAAGGVLACRGRPLLDLLVLAVLAMAWADPHCWTRLGFLLSVSAVGGILFAVDCGPRGSRWAVVLVSLGAQWGTLPLMAAVFGAWPPFSLLPNLAAVPLAGIFLPAAFLTAILPWGWEALSCTAAGSAALLGSAVMLGSKLPLINWIPLPPPAVLFGVPAIWLSYLLLQESVRHRPQVRAAAMLSAISAGILLFIPWPVPPGPWAAFLDVGQGDAAVVRTTEGQSWLIDVGDDRGPSDAARRVVLPFLRSRRIRSIDAWVISHPHRDHVGAAESLLERIPVRSAISAGRHLERGTGKHLQELLGRAGVPHRTAAAGDTLQRLSGGFVAALAPGPDTTLGVNDASLVLRFRDGAMDILFTGDLETEGEHALLEGGEDLSAHVLKVGHHGSKTSTTEPFLKRVQPSWAVVSVGKDNRFGHPDAGVLVRLRSLGAEPLRTDEMGALLFDYSQGKPLLSSFRRGRIAPR